MSNWSDPSWGMRVGINHAPAYEVSGRPFASGGIDGTSDQQVVNFPYVTRWIQVINAGSAPVKVGFGPNAFDPAIKSYFTVPSGSKSERLEIKVNRLYVSGGSAPSATDVAGHQGISVVAGLTSIHSDKVNFPTGSRDQWHLDTNAISWSGSYDGIG
jgi:hypothetical protein